MKDPSTAQEKPLVLLYEDSNYALEKLSSIILSNDNEDLSNHATEAMRETGLFCIAQVSNVRLLPILPVQPPLFSGDGDDEGANGTMYEP